jgi:hypothetical protein
MFYSRRNLNWRDIGLISQKKGWWIAQGILQIITHILIVQYCFCNVVFFAALFWDPKRSPISETLRSPRLAKPAALMKVAPEVSTDLAPTWKGARKTLPLGRFGSIFCQPVPVAVAPVAPVEGWYRLIKLHDWLHDFDDGSWDMLWYVGM